jgi:HD-GYP domain-containing protein (c-di-GMP phosphodiesterase class II)
MNANISLSFELILLLNWLLKYEKAELNSLVKHALENGFMQEIEKVSLENYTQLSDQFYNSILEFLLFFEQALLQNLIAINVNEVTNNAVLPLIKKIDFENLDIKTLWLSMQQTKEKISKSKNDLEQKPEQINNLLFEQLLKNWKPSKKSPVN